MLNENSYNTYSDISARLGFHVEGALLRACVYTWIQDGCPPGKIHRRSGRIGQFKLIAVDLGREEYQIVIEYSRSHGLKTTDVLRGAMVYTLEKHGLTITFELPKRRHL